MLHKLWKYVRKSTEKFKQIRKICYNSSDKSVWLESGVWLFLERMTRAVSINKGGLIESRLFGKLPVAEELFVRFVSQHSLPPTVPTTSNFQSGNGIKKSKENSDCFLKLGHISWIHFKLPFLWSILDQSILLVRWELHWRDCVDDCSFLMFDSPIWNFEFIWNMCICKLIYVWNICGRWCVISDVAANKSDSRIQDDFVAQISTLGRRRKSDQGFMMPRPRDGFLQIYQESNVRGGTHCGGWFTPHYRFLPPCARGGSGVFLQ